MNDGQQGQALIGVLVVMTLVFLLAGAVALGTSGLLSRMRAPDGAVSGDLASQSATSATVAHVLAGDACQAVTPSPGPSPPASPSPSPSVAPSPTPTPSPTFSVSVPEPNGAGTTTDVVYCTGLAMASRSLASVKPAANVSGCSVTDVSSQLVGAGPWWVFFDARWQRASRAWVLPAASAAAACSRNPFNPPCTQRVALSSNPVAQVAMSCPTGGMTRPTLVLRDPDGPPARVFLAQVVDDSTSGSYHLGAVATGPANAFEEVLLFQPGSGGAAQLRYEAALP